MFNSIENLRFAGIEEWFTNVVHRLNADSISAA